MTNIQWKRLAALLTALLMVINIFPVSALAADPGEETGDIGGGSGVETIFEDTFDFGTEANLTAVQLKQGENAFQDSPWELTAGELVQVVLTFELTAEILPTTGDTDLVYQLPSNLPVAAGPLETDAFTGAVAQNGKIALHLKDGKEMPPSFTLPVPVQFAEASDEQQISFGNGLTVTARVSAAGQEPAAGIYKGVLAVYIQGKKAHSALIAQPHKEKGRVQAVQVWPDENGVVTVSRGTYISTWTFYEVTGEENAYFIQADNGKYLQVTDSGVFVTDEPNIVIVNDEGDVVQLISPSGKKAVNLKSNTTANGFQAYETNSERNERFYSYTLAVNDEVEITLNANNGRFNTDAGQTSVIKETGHIGAGFTLPDESSVTREGYRLRGWALTNNASNSSEIMPGGTDYTVPDTGKVTLYAIWQKLRKIVLDANGGTEESPKPVYGMDGEEVRLPEYNGTKEGYEFLGWTDINDLKKNNNYHPIYAVGSMYEVKSRDVTTLYAAWSSTASDPVQFGIRLDGTIPDEPGNYDVSFYSPNHLYYDYGVKEKHWVVDVNAENLHIEGNHVVNNVTRNLEYLPSDEEIKNVIYPDYDPAKHYVLWYVLKWMGGTYWHVDGKIMNRDTELVTYHVITYKQNAVEGYVKDCPTGYQAVSGTEVVIGADGAPTGKVKTPSRTGYKFVEWNTQEDGNGHSYTPESTLTLDGDITLYAIWTKGTNHLIVSKQNDDGESLAGATFTMEEKTSSGRFVEKFSSPTNTEGEFKYNKMENDTIYRLTETYAPNGYKVQNSFCFKVGVDEAGSEILDLHVCDENGNTIETPSWLKIEYTAAESDDENGLARISFTIKDERILRKVTIVKTDENGQPMAGAAFTLTAGNKTYTDQLKNQSDSNGIVTIDNAVLPYATFTLTETNRDGKYAPNDAVFTLNDYVDNNNHGLKINSGEASASFRKTEGKENGLTVITYEYTITVGSVPASYDYTVHHYLKGTEIQVKDDDHLQAAYGETAQITPAVTYQNRNLTVDYYNPVQPVTITEDGQEITVYYTLPLKISANDAEKNFWETDPQLTAEVTGALEGDQDIITYSVTREAGEECGIDYVVSVSDIGNVPAYYIVETETGIFTINPLDTLTVSLDDDAYDYNGRPHANAKIATSNALSGTTTIEYSADGKAWTTDLSSITATNVADSLTIQVRATNPNYTNTATDTATLTINPIAVIVKAVAKSKIYDNDTTTDPELTVETIEGVVEGEAINYSLSREPGQDVDEYAITVTAGNNPNYTVSVVGATFTITPAAITITADNKSKTYDNDVATDPALTATVAGLSVNGIAPVYTLSRVAGQEVGEYPITVTAGENPNYTVSVVGATFTINPLDTLTVSLDDDAYDYNGQPHSNAKTAVTNALSGTTTIEYSVDGETWTEDLSSITATNVADSRTIQVRATNTNYTNTATATATLTINPIEVTVKAEGKSKIYDNDTTTDPELTVEPIEGVVEGDSINYSLSREPGQDVGEYTITVTEDNNPNYTVTVEGATFTITPAAITITAEDKSKTYDNNVTTDPALTATVTGLPENGIIPVYTLSRVAGQEVGDYVITVTAGENPNYTVTVEGATFTITPAAITITADNKSKTYDNDETTDPALTATVTGMPENGIAPVYSLSRVTGQEAGDYAITVTAGENPNYTVTVEGAIFTINPLDNLTVELDDDAYDYDGQPHANANTATTNALSGITTIEYSADGENWTEDSSSITATNVADNRTIQVRATNPNYTNTATDTATLTINPIEVTVKAEAKSKVYDNDTTTDPELTVGTIEGVVEGDSINYSLSREPGQDVGEYTITVTEDNNPNYTVTVEGATFTITPAAITITAEDKSKTYDNDAATDSALTATVTGLPENGIAPVYTLSRVAGQEVGDYVITVTAGENPNYTVTVEGATFTITPAAITITAEDKSKTYDNDATTDPALTATVTGLPENGIAPVYTLNRVAGQEVNDYVITVTAGENPNYTVNVEGATFTITPAAITITAEDKSKPYDNDATTDPILTATVTGLPENGIAPVYTLSRVAGQEVGDYVITVTAGENQNYTVSVEGATFTINPLDNLTVELEDDAYDYDGQPHSNANTAMTNALSGETTIEYSVDGENWAEDLSSITATNVADSLTIQVRATNPNYTNTATDTATLTINPIPVTVRAEDKSKDYDNNPETDPALTVEEIEGVVEGEAIDYSLSRLPGQEAGTYAITVTAGSNPNYTVSVVGATFTINPVDTLIVSLDDDAYNYNGQPHANANTATTNALSSETTIEYSADGENWTEDLSSITATNVADSLTIQVRATNPNYTNTATDTATLTINPIPVTVKAEDKSKDYDNNPETDPALTVEEIEGVVEGEAIDYSLSRLPGQEAGTYAITVTAGSNPNYTVTVEGAIFTINPVDILTVSLDDDAYDYNGQPHANANTAVTNALSGETTIEYSVDGETWTEDLSSITATNVADSLTIQVRATNPNYTNIATDIAKLTINPIPVTVKAEDKSKDYDNNPETDPALTVEEIEGVVADEAIDYSLSRLPGQEAGTYAITVTAGENPNYTVSVVGATFTINQLDILMVSLDDDAYDYNGQPHANAKTAATNALSGETTIEYSVDGETWTEDLSSITATNVADSLTIQVRATNPNYTNIATDIAKLTINPIPVTVKAEDKSKDYDNNPETDPALTVEEIEGVVAGEAIDYSLSRLPGQEAGTYAITVTAGENPNYTVSVVGATFTINQLDILMVSLDDDAYDYDGQPHANTKTAVTNALSGETTIEYSADGRNWTENLSSITATNVADSLTIQVRATNPNYTNTATDTAALTINPIPVTVKAENKSKDYDNNPETDPALTVEEIEGVVTGDTINYSLSRLPGQEAGEYPITVIEGNNPNYTVSVVWAAFTINPVDTLTVSLDDDAYDYNGQPHSNAKTAATNALSGETTIEYSVDGETWTTDLSSITATNAADSQKIQVRATNPNYTNIATDTATLTINPIPVTVKAEDKFKDYDNNPETDPALTVETIAGVVAGENINYSLSREPGQDVGEYAITVTAGENPNYTVSVEGAAFRINPVNTLTVSLDDDAYDYNGQPHANAKTAATNALSGETTIEYSADGETWTSDLSSITATNVADSLNIQVRAKNPNYSNTATDTARLTINPIPVSVRADNKSKDYDNNPETDPGLTAQVEGNIAGETISFTLSRVPGQAPGRYRITIAPGTNPNYEVTVYGGTFTINPPEVQAALPIHRLTVRYVTEDGEKAFDDFTASYPEGAYFSVTSPAKAGYVPSETVMTGRIIEDMTLTVIYTRPNVNLKISYYDLTGRQVAEPVEMLLKAGDNYEVSSPTVEGYTAFVPVVAGTMSGGNREVTVYYNYNTNSGAASGAASGGQQVTTVITDYMTPLGLGGISRGSGETTE